MNQFDIHYHSIHDCEFPRAVRGETFLYGAGLLNLHLSHRLVIESLQLMFEPEEKEEILVKCVLMKRI